MSIKHHLVIAIALMASYPQANAGAYTNAVHLNKFCTTTGIKIGAIAYEFGEDVWKNLAKSKLEIRAHETTINSASKNINPTPEDIQVATLLLPTSKKINKININTEATIKALYFERVTLEYGKISNKVAQRIWMETSKADSEENARDLAYAACMDYFNEK